MSINNKYTNLCTSCLAIIQQLQIFFYSTTSNCPAPPPQAEPVDADGEQNAPPTEVTPSTSATGSDDDTGSTGKKWKTKSEVAREEQFNKLIKIVQQEDHPVELVLGGIAKQIIRTLDSDEQDELLNEIQGVSSRFFRQKRQHLRAAKNTSNATVNADLPPPPPLTAAGQPQNGLQAAQMNKVGNGAILFEVSDMPPLQQYNIEYIRSEEGATYMKI